MLYRLSDMYAYRFYEKKDGPFITIMGYSKDEAEEIGRKAGIVNIDEIYHNRKLIENLLYKLFVKAGGQPQLRYPLYAAVYHELPENNQLHVRFEEPECIKIPMKAFSKEHVSFTFGQSPRALTRKDNHPTRRKLLLWDEAEKAINEFPYDVNEDTWLEMQIWDDRVLRDFYADGNSDVIKSFEVKERLSVQEREDLLKKYVYMNNLVKPEYFFAPYSAHGIAHAKRVLILSEELADEIHLDTYYKQILVYCAVYHDIGRMNHEIDEYHGYKSYEKIIRLHLLPRNLDRQVVEIIRFIVENHQIDTELARKNMESYKITDKKNAFKAYSVLKDADTLDRSRFGNVNKFYLCNSQSKKMVHFAYQLLQIIKEIY